MSPRWGRWSAAQKQRLFTLMALLGWGGLAIQLYLILLGRWMSDASLLGGLVNYFSFFTILTNTLAAAVLTCAADHREPTKCQAFFMQPWVSSGIAVSIIVVGVAYNVLLRQLWQPQGMQWLANALLHNVMPVLFALYWWFFVPKGLLRLRHIGLWVLYPILYFACIMLRGDLLGFYPYPFIDVDNLGYVQACINASGILAGFVGMALVTVGLDRWFGGRARPQA